MEDKRMAINIRCPQYGSSRVQLSNESSKHGCLFTVLFGVYFIFWLLIRWCIGILLLIFYDWWMAILYKVQKKGYVWQSKRWFSNRRRIYYCHDCGHNFRA